MAQGTVKWFNTQKGYGFINPDDDGSDVFVHITAVQNSGLNGLNEGQKVSYELEEQRNGKMAAVDLSVVEWAIASCDKKLYFGHVDHGLNAGGSPDALGRPFLFFLMEIFSADARQVSKLITQAKNNVPY